MRNIISSLGRNLVVLLITFASIILSVLITTMILPLLGSEEYLNAYIIAIVAPLIIAPLVSWHLIGLLINVHALEIKMRKLATFDDLTGLRNRHSFIELAVQRFNYSKRYERVFSLLLIDIDNFKQINDRHGHGSGDEMLRKFGQLIVNFKRKSDIAGRIGGDEFVLILPEANLQQAHVYADKLLEHISKQTLPVNSGNLKYTASIGIAAYDENADFSRIEDILQQADTALYQAKKRGKNCAVTFPYQGIRVARSVQETI